MKKITVQKAEQDAKQNITSAVENLRKVNSLLADSIKTNEVRMIENNEKITSLQNEQEELDLVNKASEVTIKANEETIAKLVLHI